MSTTYRKLNLLLYKNFLVRKRQWKSALFVQILIPWFMFYNLKNIKVTMQSNNHTPKNISFSPESESHFIDKLDRLSYLYIVPNNTFTESFANEVKTCLKANDKFITKFKTETDMINAYNMNNFSQHDYYNSSTNIMAIVFNDNVNIYSEETTYKILSNDFFPTLPFQESFTYYIVNSTIGRQICIDKAIFRMKKLQTNDLHIYMEKMVQPGVLEQSFGDKNSGYIVATTAVIVFLLQLSLETSKASNEKFLGVNILMAMNGVPNYLNLLGWLISGLIFSLAYTVPIIILLNIPFGEITPLLTNGNSFIFWLILTTHAAHLFTFGMHVSAYFTRSKFLITGLFVLYGGSSALYEFYLKDHPIIPYLGIIFPNILLMRACKETVYYQGSSGIGFYNLFKIDRPVYGIAGSLGAIIIFSIIGATVHFILANYICAINPGKYGAKKHPFYFLEYFRKSHNTNNYDKIDNFEFNNTNGRPFETVPESIFTPGIQIRNLRKTYNVGLFGNMHVNALKGINVDFYQGQITSLLGHNGAGKTTVMSILTGMNNPTQGLVLINGKNIKDNLDEIMNDMGLCPQENIVFPNLSVSEQFKFFAMLKNKNKSNAEIEANVKSLLEQLKLYEKRDVLPGKLSGGQKRRVCLGMALVGDSSTLILDEPTSGLDPEIRRNIWDILLKTRGQRTILISTHDMEEADILGDRIAIMHSGKLRSYGTSMFLKKLLGRGNIEVTLSVESWCNPESIRSYFGHQSEILNTDGSKIVMNVSNTPDLPDALDRIDSHKRNLGITGMSVSLITLEQVFLKVTKENEDDDTDSQEPLISASHKLNGFQKSLHAAKGLLLKKAVYTWKNITTFFLMLALIIVTILLLGLILSATTDESDPNPINLQLDIYNQAKTYYRNVMDNQSFGNNYVTSVKQFGGEAIRVNGNLTQELLDYGFQNYNDYKAYVIAGADFETTSDGMKVTAYYNDILASYAKPIALNLVSNALLKAHKNSSYSIKMSIQTFPVLANEDISIKEISVEIQSYVVPIVIMAFIFPTIALFVIHPLLENITKIKHLQRMTGVSAINYWGTMFLFDFAVMLILSIILMLGIFIVAKVNDIEFMKMEDIFIMGALLILFSTSVLPFIYCCTFLLKSMGGAMKVLSLVPIGLVVGELIMIIIYTIASEHDAVNIIRPIEKYAVLLTPYIGFFHGSISFFKISLKNAACRQMSTVYDQEKLCSHVTFCCNMDCNNGKCKNPEKFFTNFEEDVSLEGGMLSLGITTIVYFILLWILENKLIQIVIARLTAEKPQYNQKTEEQVEKIKRNIADEIKSIKTNSSHIIANTRNIENPDNNIQNRHVFLTYELRKKYGKLVAVQDITFGVNQSECFGLLGVNGAGKSTTFRMMTGEEIPQNGTIYLKEEELSGTRVSNCSQMGYCPQNDTIIRTLNAYDHLRLFARLRGIPETEVNNEVHKWIKKLNLNACASKPSGTYSGGNKRRLNIAISMIGVPDIVLLDEPTTGVDPAARRSLWNVIQSSQRNSSQAVILTSHSMEECEALCNRLAIMVGGRFVCIGPSQELKQRFGAGYDIQIKLNPEKAVTDIEGIKRDIEASLQCELIDENIGYLMYHVSSPETKWRKMYDVMSAIKHKYSSFDDFSVLSSTLEQLFLLFARAANKSH